MGDSLVRVSAAVLIEGRSVLVAQRSGHEFVPYKWSFPGGKIIDGETDEEALGRELREELSINLVSSRLIGKNAHDYGDEAQVLISFYLVEKYVGKIAASEGQELRWVNLCEPIDVDIIEANRDILKAIINRICGADEFIWDQVWTTESESFSHPKVRHFRVRQKLSVLQEMGFVVQENNVILDVGCGSGEVTPLLQEMTGTLVNGFRIISMDKSLTVLRRVSGSRAIGGSRHIVNADAEAIPLISGSVDKVVALNILEHLENEERFLSEMKRILKPGGEIYICQSNRLSSVSLHRYVQQRRGPWPYGHQKNYTPHQLNRLLGPHFNVEITKTAVPHADVPIRRAIDQVMHAVWPSWGRNIFVRARKTLAND